MMYVFLFDIDGTLISSGGAGQAAFESALAAEFNIVDGCEGIPFMGRTDRAILGDLFARHRVSNTDENWLRFRRSYLSHLPLRLADREGRVLPGVVDLLEQLATRDDVAIGLLTGNTAEGARAKLSYYELFHHFEFGGYGDEHPDRDEVAREALAAGLDYVRDRNGDSVDRRKVFVIGDTPHDIQAGRAIGAQAVAVATGQHTLEELRETKPDLLLEDLSDSQPLMTLCIE